MSVFRRVLVAFMRVEVSLGVLSLGAAAGAYLGVRASLPRTVDIGVMKSTVADLRSLHAEVLVRGREVRGSARLVDGDDVKTTPSGRARVRLDDGTLVIVDGDAELTIKGHRLALARGRVFVQAGAASRTEVAFGDATATVVSSAAAFARRS